MQTLFGRELVQSGDVPRELGRFLNDMKTFRHRVDYGSGGVERESEDLLEQTAAFVDVMAEIVGRDSTVE